jgi:5-deoxy-D-glucuronate isomerase
VPAGEELTKEGRLAHEFFVIEDGAAEVRQNGERIAELGAGDFFGEIGLLETQRRTATVTATTDLRVIVMSAKSSGGSNRSCLPSPTVFAPRSARAWPTNCPRRATP